MKQQASSWKLLSGRDCDGQRSFPSLECSSWSPDGSGDLDSSTKLIYYQQISSESQHTHSGEERNLKYSVRASSHNPQVCWVALTSLVLVADIADILPNHVNVSPAYYTFKFTGNGLYHLVDRTGQVADEAKLLALLHGKIPK
jgi:hypothetical protein